MGTAWRNGSWRASKSPCIRLPANTLVSSLTLTSQVFFLAGLELPCQGPFLITSIDQLGSCRNCEKMEHVIVMTGQFKQD